MKRSFGFVFSVLVILAAIVAFLIAGVEVTRQEMLGKWQQPKQRFGVRVPSGHIFTLVLGVGCGEPNSVIISNVSGHISIGTENRISYEFAFSTKDATPCNWLSQQPGCKSAYILTRKSLDDLLKADQRYWIEISTSDPVPSGCSLWLCWVQRNYQARKSK